MYFPDGSLYTGYFNAGIPNGEGRFITNEGIYYEGEVLNGLAEGKGKLNNGPKGYIFEGMWKQDYP